MANKNVKYEFNNGTNISMTNYEDQISFSTESSTGTVFIPMSVDEAKQVAKTLWHIIKTIENSYKLKF